MSIGKLNRQGLPFNNVIASGIATADITPGRTIEALTLVLGGTTFTSAHIDYVKIKANGKPVVDATGAQLEKLAEFRGDTVTTHLPIYFADFRGLDSLDHAVGAFDTSRGIKSLTVEVKIAGATAPTLKYLVQESNAQVNGDGTPKAYSPVLSKILRYPYNISTGGRLPIALPFGAVNGAIIKRIHITHGVADNVEEVICKQDAITIHETTKADNEFYNSRFGLVNQADTYSLDFVADGGFKNAWDTRDATSIELIPTFGAADSGEVIVEYLDVLGNL
jgi:hypothetical protein